MSTKNLKELYDKFSADGAPLPDYETFERFVEPDDTSFWFNDFVSAAARAIGSHNSSTGSNRNDGSNGKNGSNGNNGSDAGAAQVAQKQPQAQTPQAPQARTSQAQEPAWQPTTQERIRMMEGVRTAVQPFSKSVQGRTDAVRRNAERHTAEGLQRQRLAEARAEAAGLDTRLTGMGGVPGRWDAGSYGNNENDGSGATPDLTQTASPVVYDTTVDEQGRTQIVWLMPDGTLTSDRGVAEQGAARARQNRLMSQFVDRMHTNGLDPAKQADVQKQAQLDYEEPMRRAVDIAWNKAEDADKAANDAYDKEVQEHGMTWRDAIASSDANGMHVTPPSTRDIADMRRRVSHKKAFSLAKMTEDALANMPEYYRKEMLDAYTQHFKGDRKKAEAAFRDEISQMLYGRLVERAMPKGTAEFVARKIADGNLVSPEWAAELTASAMADSYDENIARNAAMAQYGKEHRVADIFGTVAGMAADPVTYVSGGVGGAAGKAAMSTVARTMAEGSLKGAAMGVAKRVAGSTLGGRLAAGMVGGGATLGPYEALKNIQEQMYTGGVADYSTGKRGGYSLGAVLGAAGRGVVLGTAMGSIAPVTGNVADRIVGKVGGTAGKAGVRAAQGVTNVVAEGTVFAMPEWISGDADFVDAWTDGMATALGFKTSHAIKSVPRTIEALRPKKDARGRVTDGMDFEQRLRERLNGAGRGMALTKEDERELRDNGYGGLADLFGGEHVKTNGKVHLVRGKDGTWNMVVRDGEGVKERPEGTTTKEERASAPYAGNVEMDGYDAMRQLMGDGRVSEAARAKCYWILTGRTVPMSTVAAWQTEEHGDGTYTVRSVTAGGDVITSRRFKNKRDAQGEEMKIRRQAEYNTVEVGERYADRRAFEAAAEYVAGEYGTTAEAVRNAAANVEAGKGTAGEQEIYNRYGEALETRRGEMSAEAIRKRIEAENVCSIDAILGKSPDKRTEAEQAIVERYLEELYPEGMSNKSDRSYENTGNAENTENAGGDNGQKRLPGGVGDELPPEGPTGPIGPNDTGAPEDANAGRAGNVPTAEAETARAEAMSAAYESLEEAFGGREDLLADVKDDPWETLRDPELTGEQREAVVQLLNVESGMSNVELGDAQSQGMTAEVAVAAARRVNHESGMVVPARTVPMKDAPSEDVYIVSGEVRMQPDGSVIDRGNSDSFIVVCDSEGNYHATSPERLESVGEAVTPEQWAKTMSNVAQEQPQETGVGNNENDRNNGSDGGEPMRGEGLAQGEEPAGYDVQGNPVDGQGRLVVESVGSMDEITDGDFEAPTRNVQLSDLPENVAAAIGSGGKPIVIKKSVFEKNRDNHPEIDAAESRSILERALYNPDLVGSVQARRRPDYRVAIQTGDRNAVVVLDIYESKDNTEIVGWREINERGLERMRRQAAKDDGQLIILSPSDKSGSAAALSTLQDGLSSVGKGSENGLDAQGARASALSRVPTDAKGEPMFEQAEDAATAWDALVEYSGGDVATAKEIAAVMAQEKRNEYERARKLKPKGKTPAEILASKRDIAAEQSRTQLEYERWRQMAEVERGREAVAEREREAVARRAAAEQAERERAERAAQAEADRLRLERLNGVPDWRADTPEHARARGYRRSGPEVVERQGAVEAVRGKDVRVKFAKDTTADGVAAVIDVDDLQPSHVQGNRNVRHFIPEAQPKDRKDAVSKVSAQDIARDIRPEEITGSITAYTGAPSVNGRGETIQGNSRADALKWMYDSEPEQAAKYKAYLVEHAADFGMDAEDIEAMERPVLVNMLDVSDGEAIRLGQYVQADTESGGVERIRGRAAARKMGADMREYAERLLSSDDEDASISQLVAANGVKTLQWMNTRGYITDTQYASCFDRKGELTGNAAEDFKDVLYQGIFEGGSVEIEEMFAKLPAKVQRAILATAYRDYDSPEADSIRGEIQQAIVLYNEMMMYPQYAGATNIESALTAVGAWSQQYAFDDASGESYLPAERFSNFALHLAAMYKGMSQRGLQKMFNDLYDTIQGVGEDTLFESVERTPHTIAEAVKKVLGIDYKPVNERNNGETGNVPMADDSEVGQGGRRGGTTDVGSRERVAGTGRAYERGAGASDDSRGTGKGREIKPSEVDGRFIGRSLSEREATELVGRMEASAEVAPTVELTPENWLAQFGEDGMVDTPIGVVKMGENQFIKMYSRGRAEYFGMVYPTLHTPDVIMEKNAPAEGAERDTKFIFVKTFVKDDGSRLVHFESITVQRDGMEVSVSSHEAAVKDIKKDMQNEKILHISEKLSPGSEGSLTETSGGSKRPDLVPASDGTSLRGKDTTKSADVQGKNDNIVGGQGETPMSAKIKTASAEVNTDPTEAQKEAGNYKKGHVQVGTFDITIEQPQGSVRKGTDADGKQWESKMNNTYGYIRGAVGVDGDHIDVFLSNDIDDWNGRKVFVVDQYNPDGSFDEHKVMLGFNDQDEAKGDYLANYEQGWENGRRIDITGVNLEDFEKWIESSKRKIKPFGEYSSVKKDVVEEKNGGSGLNGRTGNTGSNGENENNGSKAAEIAHLEELLEKPGADKKLVRAEIARLRGEGQKAAKPKRESVFQQAERVAKGARDKREGAKNVGYDAETKKWKGIPSGDIVATSAADKAGIITGYTRDPRIVSVHSTKTGRTWLEVDVFDDNAETPVRIIEALEEEGYEIEGRGGFSTVNFDNYNDAKAFSDHVREVQKRVDAEREGAEEGAASRKLSAEEVAEIIGQIELQAEIAPEIELTIENWDKLFGEDGIVSTPIGDVKMGKNQFAKLMRDGRNSKLGMLKPTLETPTIIIEDTSEAKPGDKTERGSSYIFIKGFTKANGTRLYFFTSVTVSKDGKEVVVSNQEKSRNRISRLIQEGNMLWRTPKDATAPSAEGQGLDYAQPIEAETATKGSGITPQSIPSEGKGTTKSSNVQGKDGKEEEVEVDADQAAKLRKSPGFELSTKKVKGKVTVNPKDYAPWRKTAEDNKRPQLRGVHYEEGLAMATDTASIIMVRSKYPTAWEGKTIGWDGKALDFEYGYVPWRKLLSMHRKAAYAVDAAAFKAAVEQARADEASGEFNVSDYAIGVPYHGGKIYIALKRAELLADLLDNVKHGELRLNGTGQYLCLSGDGVYSIHMGVSKESLSYGLGTHVVDIPSGGVKQSKVDGAVAEGVEASEAVLRDAVIGRLREAGVEVVTDVAAGQKVLDEANEETGMSNAGQQQVRLHARLSALTKAANTIRGWLDGNKRGKTFTIELPEATQRMIRKVMGRDFDSHNITANGVVHAQKNHGVGGRKLNERSIPLTTVDMELMPYIMTAPDYVRRGSDDMSGRVSVRFYKELGNGYVVVAEKEYKNSPDDMETITMWAEMSDKATNAQREAALDTHVQNAILDIDAAKIRRDAENAIENDIKIREHRVYHGSGADFESFDHSHMGTGEGAQVFGWGTYVTEVEGIGRGYATKIVTNNSTNLSSIARQHNAKRFLKKYPTFEAFKAYVDETRPDKSDIALNYYNQNVDDAKGQRHLYTVEIPEDTGENYIDHDKGLTPSQATRVRTALEGIGVDLEDFARRGWRLDMPFEYVYNIMIPNAIRGSRYEVAGNVQRKASEFLSQLGFTGIKYPAEYTSGGRADGAKNYVIFDDKDLKITDHVRFFRTGEGEAYGFTVGGKIYIDPRIATAETPVHEYAHLWAEALRCGNAEEWSNVVGLMKDTPVWDEVRERYPELESEDEIADEVIATYSGRRGAERLREEAKKVAEGRGSVFEKAEAISALERVKQALARFWKGVCDFLHIRYTSAEEVADRVMKDMLDGVNPREVLHKNEQNAVIQRVNPMEDDYHTGVRGVEDIRTLREAIAEARAEGEEGGWDALSSYPDVSNAMLEAVLRSGRVRVYSSKPIEAGVFVTPSRMQAEDYAGGGKVYSKEVSVDDVAWLNTDEGQLAKTMSNVESGMSNRLRFQYVGEKGAEGLAAANARFNEELERYQAGEMDKNEMLHLGKPQGVMRVFLPDLPIVMRQRVIKKGSEKKHDVDVFAIMNMPQHLSSPIFVFQRSENTIGVLTDMRDRNGKNVCVAVELKRQMQQGAEYLEVNDVRSFHGREFKNIVEPIANNKTLKWVDKEKGLAYLSSASQPVQQEIDKRVLETAAKVVENFENPKVSGEKDAEAGQNENNGNAGNYENYENNGKNESDMRYRTSEELDSEYGRQWLDEQTNSDGRHTTQVKNTLSSYKKFGEWVKREARGREVDVLDASSGLGIGTEWMRDNGIKVEDVEPYPSEHRTTPTYKSYGDIKKKYDYIISNAVLNVIPDDWRAALLHDMADKLKVGGRLVINVRSAESIRSQGKEGETRITLDSPSEILVLRPDGSIKAYQKGFTKSELKEWCEKELGAGYKVEIANKGNAGGSYDTAVVVTKNNESGTVGVASETGRPSRSAQAVSNSSAKVSKKSEYRVGLEKLSDRLGEKGMGAHEFLYGIAKAFGLKGDGLRASFYQDLGNSVGIRVSDHSANTDNIASKNANSEVYGLVVKLGRHRFKSNADADYLEYVYYPDRLDGARQKEIVDGLKGFVDSGDYTLLPKPDRVNRSGRFEVAESGFSDENNGNNENTGNNSDPEVMAARARELAELLNTPVRIIRTEEEVAALPSVRQRRMKGSFNPMTGEVTIVVPNNANMADIENTFVHEVVGHDGLRVLFPDEAKLNNALDELYRVSKDEIRSTIDRMAQKMYDAEVDRIREKKRKEHEANGEDANASYYADMAAAHAEAGKKREQFKRDATEEYGADLAGRIGEKGFEKMSAAEQTFWGRLKAMLQKALQRLLDGLKIRSKRQWGDKEWAFVLHEAFKRKRNGGRPTIFDMADTEVMRRKTGFGEMSNVESYGRDGKGNQKETVNLQYGKRLGQNQSGEYRRPEGSADGREVDTDASRRLAAVSDRSDIRVFEEGHSAHREQHIDDSQRYRREAEGERLVAIAKANGLFIPREKIKSFGERVSKQSRESEVYINFDESRVYKVKNPYAMAGSWYKNHIEAEDAIYEYLLHNKYFPETAYKFEGIAEDVDGVRIVLSQPLIKSRRTATNEEVKAYLESKGFRSEPPYFYTNDDVWVSDFNGDNALIGEDGQVYLIDPVIDIDTHKTMKDLIGDSDRDGGIKFRDGDDGLGEAIAQMKEAASLANADNRQTKEDAMKAIGGNLSKLRQAMARQRGYDLSTVKSITDLVKRMLENGLLDDLGKAETKRILSTAANVTGREDTSKYVQKVMDIMVDNQLRRSRDALGRLLSIRGKRVDGRGIEVQGALDANGVAVLQAFKKSKGLDWATIDERISDAFNRMSSEDDALAEEATLEYSGLVFARQYVSDITESVAEEKGLREDLRQAKEDHVSGRLDDASYRQFVSATEEAIRDNKVERAEAYRELIERLGGELGESAERARQWRESEKARVGEIHHNANSDMEGRPTDEHHKSTAAEKLANNDLVRFLLASLATFDQMLRMFGRKSVRGEGYLWNRYMRGWEEATSREYTGYRDALRELDAKVSEVFGKKMSWGDLFTLERHMDGGSVRFWDGGEMKEHKLTQGNLLYIYMVDKMPDGRMKLRHMGITEGDVEAIKALLDPRFVRLADWLQDEFLVKKRNKYNEVHKRMFGTSMSAIENYFPLKILANARTERIDINDESTTPAQPSTSTGSIIKRRRNKLALDITGADAFSVILDHLQEMERWAAFAEYNRDLNALLSYKRFRNQVLNMNSAYGSGRVLWNNFRDVCRMAAGAYRPPVAKLDKAAVNIAKGVTAAKVNFRVFTALKQLLSMPAYISDCNPVHFAANLANPVKAWEWCMKNLPLFEKRWRSRMAGDPRLLKSEMDWRAWRSRVVEISSRIGMSPNAFVDALTVAIGTRAMYQTKKAKYLRWGMSETAADARAKQDATILFNQTQQSSEGAFLSTLQVDRSWLSVLFTVFRNASMSYTRQQYDAFRNLGHRLQPGYKSQSLEFMAKQFERDGIEQGNAVKAAHQEYYRGVSRDLARVAVFGYILQLAWNLGAYLPYLLLGNDDDEKDAMWKDVWNHTAFGSIEGLTGGDVYSSAGQMWLNGDMKWSQLVKDMPIASDLAGIYSKMGSDKVSAINDVINLLVQSGIGVNPQSLTDAVAAVMDYSSGDADTSREYALMVARVLNCPQSQLDKVYFDELDATAREASMMTPAEIAQRYAEYKALRGAPLTGWMRSEAQQDSVEGRWRKRALTVAREKLDNRVATEKTKMLLGQYDSLNKRKNDIGKLRKGNVEEYRKELRRLYRDNDFRIYYRMQRYKRDIKEQTERYLRTQSTRERDSLVRSMMSTRDRMLQDVEALEDTPQ